MTAVGMSAGNSTNFHSWDATRHIAIIRAEKR
jgi:hypothetical protein